MATQGDTQGVLERCTSNSGELAGVYNLLTSGSVAREKIRERYWNARGVDLRAFRSTRGGGVVPGWGGGGLVK